MAPPRGVYIGSRLVKVPPPPPSSGSDDVGMERSAAWVWLVSSRLDPGEVVRPEEIFIRRTESGVAVDIVISGSGASVNGFSFV